MKYKREGFALRVLFYYANALGGGAKDPILETRIKHTGAPLRSLARSICVNMPLCSISGKGI
jgi:hypothetical protein